MFFKKQTRFEKVKEGVVRTFNRLDKKQVLVFTALLVATALGVRKRLMS